jgi:hypothetical protein
MVIEVIKKLVNFTTKIEVPKISVKKRKRYPIIPGWSNGGQKIASPFLMVFKV